MQTILHLPSFYRGNDQSQKSRTKTPSKPLSIERNFGCLKACSVFLKTQLICPATHYQESFLISGEGTPPDPLQIGARGQAKLEHVLKGLFWFFFPIDWYFLVIYTMNYY